jgi:hypothetical protein
MYSDIIHRAIAKLGFTGRFAPKQHAKKAED